MKYLSEEDEQHVAEDMQGQPRASLACSVLLDAKPCPFCGSNRIVKGERYFAMCVDCGATGPERNGDATVRKFTGDWNTRIPSTAQACAETGRHYVCIERDPDHCETGRQRLTATERDLLPPSNKISEEAGRKE